MNFRRGKIAHKQKMHILEELSREKVKYHEFLR